MRDPRTDELLDEAGRTASRLHLALAWTDGIRGEQAKSCSRTGAAAWKRARPLSADPEAAAGFFKSRARARNPVVVASRSGLVLIENDGGEELLETFGISSLPTTVAVRSRRGIHRYYLPPEGREPMKVQIAEDGITTSSDGYVVGGGALHPAGVVYEYLNGTEVITVLPVELYDRLVELGGETREQTARSFETGEPIPTGQRNDAIFSRALALTRDGVPAANALAELLKLNAEQCRPPLAEDLVRKQLEGARKWSRSHPTEQEQLREKARRLLDDDGAETNEPQPPRKRKPARELVRRPLSRIPIERAELLKGTPLPVGTLSLASGIGGLGKSAWALACAKHVTEHHGAVLVISYEDAAGAVIRPRFEALGGDLERLHVLEVASNNGEVSFPTDLPELERHVRETRARLVILDPVSASIDLKLDAHRDQDVRVVLGQLARLAERERLAALQIAHLNKAPGGDPYLRINGSTAFYNASRLVLTVTADPSDPDWHRIVAAHKYNYGAVPPPERWRVVMKTLVSPVGLVDVMTLEFVEVADDVTREEVLAPSANDKHTRAAVLILEMLAGGRQQSAKVKAAGMAQGLSDRTMKRAAAELEVVIEDETTATGRVTYWALPGGVGPTPTSETWPDPSSPHGHDDPGGSGQTGTGGVWPDLPCPRHEGLHKVTSRAAGLVYLACGCFLHDDGNE